MNPEISKPWKNPVQFTKTEGIQFKETKEVENLNISFDEIYQDLSIKMQT